MISARLGQSWGSIAQATVVAVALCCGAATAEPAAAQAAPWRLFVPPAAAATTDRDLPVQKHPGDTEVTRAWQVMSAIHNYVATQLNQRQPG
jgi:hypothetical protein